jgi:hypothetical protein
MTTRKIDIRHFVFHFCHFERSRGISNCPNFAMASYATRNLARENRTRRSTFFNVVEVDPGLNVISIT